MMPLRRIGLLLAIALVVCLAGRAAYAVQPNEMLDDPVLEQRARDISGQLRCMVCQNESIDESHAELAHDLRVLVRDRLKKGDTDQEAIDYIADRYGEFVLLKPRFNMRNLLLWATPLIVLMGGAALALTTARRRGRALSTLSPDEEESLKRVLDERS
jgi:cytochrome c-type biogenesis protein CcmH